MRIVIGVKREAATVRANFDIGGKTKISVNDRTRFPDGLTRQTLIEIKNVAKQGFTQQLRDYSNHGQKEGLKFNLFLRPDTQVTRPLQNEFNKGLINRMDIPIPMRK